MTLRIISSVIGALFLQQVQLFSQSAERTHELSAIIYDEFYVPVAATHVINLNSHEGDVTDSLGIFRLPVYPTDTLLIRNIIFWDTLVPVSEAEINHYIRLRRRRYEIEEARIFEWGATYDDFREAFIGMPVQQTLAASMELPRQNPDKVPLEMNEEAVKSMGLLLTQPISYFYYNFSKHAKSARKVYWLKKNQEKQDQFDVLVSAENLSEITGLTGIKLQQFRAFLFTRIVCDFHCSELEIYNEIYGLWKVYQELEERGIPEDAAGN